MKKNNISPTKVLFQVRNFDELLRRQVKAASVMENRSLAEWVEEACRKQLAEPKTKPK